MILESVGKFHLNSVCGKTDLVNIIIIYSFFPSDCLPERE